MKIIKICSTYFYYMVWNYIVSNQHMIMKHNKLFNLIIIRNKIKYIMTVLLTIILSFLVPILRFDFSQNWLICPLLITSFCYKSYISNTKFILSIPYEFFISMYTYVPFICASKLTCIFQSENEMYLEWRVYILYILI